MPPTSRSAAKRRATHVKAFEHAAGNTNAMVDGRIYNEFMERLHAPSVNPRDTWLNRNIERALRWTMLDKPPSFGLLHGADDRAPASSARR